MNKNTVVIRGEWSGGSLWWTGTMWSTERSQAHSYAELQYTPRVLPWGDKKIHRCVAQYKRYKGVVPMAFIEWAHAR